LEHEISRKGIEMDRAKIDVIGKLFMPKCMKDIRSFLEHTGFYRRLSRTLARLLDP